MPKFIEPMLSEHISGLATSGAASRCSTRHVEAAAGRHVDHRVGRLLDARQELHEDRGVRRRAAVLGIARVQMQDRGAGLRCGDRLRRDVLRGQRKRVRHRRRMNAARDRASDDDLVRSRIWHEIIPRLEPARRSSPCTTLRRSAASRVPHPVGRTAQCADRLCAYSVICWRTARPLHRASRGPPCVRKTCQS